MIFKKLSNLFFEFDFFKNVILVFEVKDMAKVGNAKKRGHFYRVLVKYMVHSTFFSNNHNVLFSNSLENIADFWNSLPLESGLWVLLF